MNGDKRVVLRIEVQHDDVEENGGWQAVSGYDLSAPLRSQAASQELSDALDDVFGQLVSRLWRDREEVL